MKRTLVCSTLLASTTAAFADDDPHLWLEGVEDEAAIEWVKARNATSTEALTSTDDFEAMRTRLLSIFDSDERIPYVSKRGEHLYNFWRDAEHPRGLWRRTTLDSYRSDAPEWDVVLDVDALGAEEDENWVWHGATCLYPDYDRCLVRLSRGGADADVVREFDVPTRTFVDGGFVLPEAKSRVSWIDRDTLFVATDFGEGTMTDSGYPRQVKAWSRGTPLASATLVYEGAAEDISIGGYGDLTPGFERQFVYRALTFYTGKLWERTRKGDLVEIFKQDSAEASVDREWLYLELREDWELEGQTYKAGSLLVAPYKQWMKGKRNLQVIFEPDETSSLAGYSSTRNHLIVNVLQHVKNSLTVWTPAKKGPWTSAPLEGMPEFGTISASPVDAMEGDDLWLTVSDFLTPSSLYYGAVGQTEPELLQQLPSFFDAEGLEVSQHFATSKDGTQVPYFQIAPKDLTLDGSAKTLLYGYGGFEVSLTPGYSATIGAAWLEKGGVYVLANIRGGGEYGPRWHQAALRENRNKAYEDFAAIGEDLVERGVTSPERLGIRGGSNGGLLMGNMYTMFPDHWGAIVCQVPLLDMKRYTKLLAGASWAGEYGDPDNPDDWAFLQNYSPYHNLGEGDGPPILITTSTRDDRVHPGHARKFAAALAELDQDVLYYENMEGGHGGAANNEQSAFMQTLAYAFLWSRLDPAYAPPAPTQDENEEAADDATAP